MSNGDQVVSSAGSLEPAGLIGIYTLTPTHCGSGQAAGAVDLPIIREAHTRFPILPATAIKGVARQFVERRAPALDWADFENAVYAVAGGAANCAALVTRDPNGFAGAPLPVRSPSAALALLRAEAAS